MSGHTRAEAFRVSFSLVTVGAQPDPRLEDGWEEVPEAEKELALTIFDGAPKGKIQYFSATITDVVDENAPISNTVSSQFFNKDQSDGQAELDNLLPYVAAQVAGRYSQIAPIQKTDKRLIEWGGILPSSKNLRKLN